MLARPPERTSRDLALAIGREALVVSLAFVAGCGGYIGALKAEPIWPQDYFAAIGAGALLALAKMIPTGGGSKQS
jgi:hypothetical protein